MSSNPLASLPANGISFIKGTSKTLELTITDAFDEAVDITGSRVIFSVKTLLTDPAPLIQKTSDTVAEVDITAPRLGKAQIFLSPSDTAGLDSQDYVFDVWVILSSGKRYAVIPPSTFRLEPSVTIIP